MDTIGILAYGSLIEDTGQEILGLLQKRITTTTPFPVEFAPLSRSRGEAPTLIPFENGNAVNAQILVLDGRTTIERVSNILYQRETRNPNRNYIRPVDRDLTINTVLVDMILNFENVETVLYTRIGSNISIVTPLILAQHAIMSA
jgi:hypothetical protein